MAISLCVSHGPEPQCRRGFLTAAALPSSVLSVRSAGVRERKVTCQGHWWKDLPVWEGCLVCGAQSHSLTPSLAVSEPDCRSQGQQWRALPLEKHFFGLTDANSAPTTGLSLCGHLSSPFLFRCWHFQLHVTNAGAFEIQKKLRGSTSDK